MVRQPRRGWPKALPSPAVAMVRWIVIRLFSGAALAAIVVADGTVAQVQKEGPVVYCRDAARGLVTRMLARDCPRADVISEKYAQALRDESIERRRRLMLGDKPAS